MRVVVPRNAGDHGYFALQVNGGLRWLGGGRCWLGFGLGLGCRRLGGGWLGLLGLGGGRHGFGGGRYGLGLSGRCGRRFGRGGNGLGGGARQGAEYLSRPVLGGMFLGRLIWSCCLARHFGEELGGRGVLGPLPGAGGGRRDPGSGRRGSRRGTRRERGGSAWDVRRAFGLAFRRGGEAAPPRGGRGGLSLGGYRLGPRRLLRGPVVRAGRRGLRRGAGPGRSGGDRGLPGRNPGRGLRGRDGHGLRPRPGQLRFGRSWLAEQLVPFDQRADAQGQQGYAAHADRDVDQGQLARDDPRDQQSDRDGHEKRAEPDHSVLSAILSTRSPTGARARALPQRCGSHRNGARPRQAYRTGQDPGRRYARPPARSVRLASAAASRLRRRGSHRSR